MRVVFTEQFIGAYIAAPPEIHKLFGKQLAHLLRDPRHRSLRAERYPARGPDVWQARVNSGWRFYYRLEAGTYYLLDVIPHPK